MRMTASLSGLFKPITKLLDGSNEFLNLSWSVVGYQGPDMLVVASILRRIRTSGVAGCGLCWRWICQLFTERKSYKHYYVFPIVGFFASFLGAALLVQHQIITSRMAAEESERVVQQRHAEDLLLRREQLNESKIANEHLRALREQQGLSQSDLERLRNLGEKRAQNGEDRLANAEKQQGAVKAQDDSRCDKNQVCWFVGDGFDKGLDHALLLKTGQQTDDFKRTIAYLTRGAVRIECCTIDDLGPDDYL